MPRPGYEAELAQIQAYYDRQQQVLEQHYRIKEQLLQQQQEQLQQQRATWPRREEGGEPRQQPGEDIVDSQAQDQGQGTAGHGGAAGRRGKTAATQRPRTSAGPQAPTISWVLKPTGANGPESCAGARGPVAASTPALFRKMLASTSARDATLARRRQQATLARLREPYNVAAGAQPRQPSRWAKPSMSHHPHEAATSTARSHGGEGAYPARPAAAADAAPELAFLLDPDQHEAWVPESRPPVPGSSMEPAPQAQQGAAQESLAGYSTYQVAGPGAPPAVDALRAARQGWGKGQAQAKMPAGPTPAGLLPASATAPAPPAVLAGTFPPAPHPPPQGPLHMYGTGPPPAGFHAVQGSLQVASVAMWEMMSLVSMRAVLSQAVSAMSTQMSSMASQIIQQAAAPALASLPMLHQAQAMQGGMGMPYLQPGGGTVMMGPQGPFVLPPGTILGGMGLPGQQLQQGLPMQMMTAADLAGLQGQQQQQQANLQATQTYVPGSGEAVMQSQGQQEAGAQAQYGQVGLTVRASRCLCACVHDGGGV